MDTFMGLLAIVLIIMLLLSSNLWTYKLYKKEKCERFMKSNKIQSKFQEKVEEFYKVNKFYPRYCFAPTSFYEDTEWFPTCCIYHDDGMKYCLGICLVELNDIKEIQLV